MSRGRGKKQNGGLLKSPGKEGKPISRFKADPTDFPVIEKAVESISFKEVNDATKRP